MRQEIDRILILGFEVHLGDYKDIEIDDNDILENMKKKI
jgi:hypothetical protein